MALATAAPTYPWDPKTGCMACCSGEPYPSEPMYAVSTVSL